MRTLMLLVLATCLLLAAEGRFSGTWSSSYSDANGNIQLQLSPAPEVTFTIKGREVKTKVISSKADDSKFEIQYEFTLEEAKLVSTILGTVEAGRMRGTYQTKSADGETVDTGTLTAKPAE